MELNENEEPLVLTNNWDRWKILGFILLVICLFSFSFTHVNIYESGYLQISAEILVWVGGFSVIIILLIIGFLMTATTSLYDDRIERKALFKPLVTVHLKDLTGKREEYSRAGLILYLYSGDKKLTITDTNNVKAFYKKYKNLNLPEMPFTFSWKGIVFALVFFIGIFGGPAFYYTAVSIRDHNKGKGLKTLTQMTVVDQSYKHTKGGPYTTLLKFKGLENYTFFAKEKLPYTYPDKYCNLKILQYDYDIKIAHTRQPSFWDEHFDWEKIQIQSFQWPDSIYY